MMTRARARAFHVLPAALFAAAAAFAAAPQTTAPQAPPPAATTALAPPLKELGATYNYAQQVRWSAPERFLVGRWDGTLGIFRPPVPAKEFGPVLTGVYRAPSGQGIQMLAVGGDDLFVSSNDDRSLAVWTRPRRRRGDDAFAARLFAFDAAYGVANSGVFLTRAGRSYLATGHENGYLLVWDANLRKGRLALRKVVDVRSPDPIPSPFPLRNVREVAVWREGIVITGSEDGDVVMLRVPEGDVLARQRYNPTAQRGINDIAVLGDYLLVVNCSVGPADKNTWLFGLSLGAFRYLDAVDLKKDLTRPQSFAFNDALAEIGGKVLGFVSTEEGLLWSLEVTPPGRLTVATPTPVGFPVGDALDYDPRSRSLAVVGLTLYLYRVESP